MYIFTLQDTDSEVDSEVVVRKKPGPKPKNTQLSGNTPQRGRPPKDPIPLKKRLHALAKYMLDYAVRSPQYIFLLNLPVSFSVRRRQKTYVRFHGKTVKETLL